MDIEALAPELRLALALLSADRARRSPENLQRIVGAQFDWPYFAHLVVDRHGIGPLIARRLSAAKCLSVPAAERDQLEQCYHANVQQHLLQKRQVVLLQRALAAAGIAPILVKGLSIEDRFYEHGGLREAGDLDLLVPPADVAQCDAIFGGIGYQRLKPEKLPGRVGGKLYAMVARHFVYADVHSGQTLELHWRLTKSRSALPPGFWVELDGTERLALGRSCHVTVLAPLAQFIHVAVHGTEHAWASLKWLADLGPMIAPLSDQDWERLLAYGRAMRLLPALLLAANLARHLLDARCAPFLLEALERHEQVRRLTARSVRILQRETPLKEAWAAEPSARYAEQFQHELGISGSFTHRIETIAQFPFYYMYFLSRSWLGSRQRAG